MAEIPPHAVLSEEVQKLLRGRRLISAVFLTFQFEPGFFEQEILPVLLDVSVSHATPIRLLQLEAALRDFQGNIAVYYDANGLVPGDAGSPVLDIRRLPVQHRTGIFHPKNFFLFVEDPVPDKAGHFARALLVSAMSANLTRRGWWENVEVCHIEEIGEDGRTRLRDDLIGLLEALRRKVAGDADQSALGEILGFLRRSTDQRVQRSTSGGLHPHFYFTGREPLPEFLERVAGGRLVGTYLEIISPFFDDADTCAPLLGLVERFRPREVRVHLPESPNGEVACRAELYRAVRDMEGVSWGRLPKDFLRLGQSEDAGLRSVHAKVYRFFTQNPKSEIYFVGSANLTRAAHQSGGNLETGFLVEVTPVRRPEFWLTPVARDPSDFRVQKEGDAAASGGTRLNIRYYWDKELAEGYWDGSTPSPVLQLAARGVPLGAVGPLNPYSWTNLGAELAGKLEAILRETSFLEVTGDGQVPGLLLVQEEGMSHRPSVLMTLSATDILRYWSLLTQEQKAAFLESRAPDTALLGSGADLVARAKWTLEPHTLFDKFAGLFHAFGCLERSVRDSLEKGRVKDAQYRIFGRKYDSLGYLLDRVLEEKGSGDSVDKYVIVLCARQLCSELRRDYPDFWADRGDDAGALEERFHSATAIRAQLIAQDPATLPEFLDWFDDWFLRRAEPVEIQK